MFVIGLDIGTTCVKALILARDGRIAASGSRELKLFSNGCHMEQRAEDWTEAATAAVREALREIDGSRVEAVSLSTQGASTVALDRDGKTIGNALTWMDSRSVEEAAELERKLSNEYIYGATGWKVNPSLDAAKIMHMKKQPRYGKASSFLSTLEFMNRFLTGSAVIDPTNAAMRQLYHIGNGCWDSRILEASGIREQELTPVLPSGAEVGKLCKNAADLMGLKTGIPVFNGLHDQYCAAVGAGAVHEGDMLLSAGTAWVLLGVGTKPLKTKSFIAAGKHPVDGLYGSLASLICSGGSLQWYRNHFLREDFGEMDREVAKRKDEDLCFYPYLAGAAYPIWNPKAKGAFTGITLAHDRFDFARAIMEGVTFGAKRGLEDFANNGFAVRRLILVGGAAKSRIWCQMISDITETPVLRLNQTELCAVGAGMIAACGLGWYDGYETAAKTITHVEHVYEPIPENLPYYEKKYTKFRKMRDGMQNDSEGSAG